MKPSNFNRLLRHRALAFLATAAIVAAAAALAFAIHDRNQAASDPGSPAVDFSQVTPRPFTGYPTAFATPVLTPPACQAPENERPATELPPLSCRNSAGEPPPGAIPTAPPGPRAAPAGALAGWQIIDNKLFRYQLAIPADWYSDMRPEGGTFWVSDPAGTTELLDPNSNAPGGVLMQFTAREVVPPRDPDGFLPAEEERLKAPNARFGNLDGAFWDEGPGEGLAHFIHAVFAKDGVLFRVDVYIAGDRASAASESDVALVNDILATLTPY